MATPLADTLKRLMDPTNPWTGAGWNITGQSQYIREHGQARAEARARDAGTKLNGPRPTLALGVDQRTFAEVAIVRPSNPPIYRFMVPQKRDEGDIRITDDGEARVTTENDVRTYRD